MSVRLSLKHNRRRKALVATAFGEGSMERAFVINLVAVLSEGYTILTFLIRLMLSFTLSFDFFEISLEAFMLHKLIIVGKAIDAFLARTMVAWLLDFLNIIFSNSETVDAL